jgi:anti-sigma-K factor RskA
VDIKAYIESGAIEAYVLGLASATEAAELETLRKQSPELDNAIIAFEMRLERTAMAEAEAPPAFIKQQLNERLAGGFGSNGSGKVLPIENRAAIKPLWKYIAAASIILLVVSAALNFYLYDRYRSADTAYNELFTQTKTLQANNDVMNTRLNEMNESMKIMADPAVIPISLTADATPKKGENFRATVYWDSKTKDVYLLSNNLPKAPAGKQYQLWAIVDGQPVDAGMMDDCTGVCRMKNIPKAQLFAITLEETGGKPRPEGEMYVLGKI